jgi:DNA-binding NarL/FixJ family response regulator
MDAKIRILLVDDHNVVRHGLRLLFEACPDIEVVGEADNGRQAVELGEKLQPDVIVLDVVMPMLNGVETTRQLARATPKSKVVVLSSYSEHDKVEQLVEAGACGYVIKQSASDELLTAIRAIHQGGAFLSPPVCKGVLEEFRQAILRKRAESGEARLTSRETEVLQLVAEGYANKQIADMLGISVKTAEKHRQELMNKLNIHETASLTRYAVAQGLVELPAASLQRKAPPAP